MDFIIGTTNSAKVRGSKEGINNSFPEAIISNFEVGSDVQINLLEMKKRKAGAINRATLARLQ